MPNMESPMGHGEYAAEFDSDMDYLDDPDRFYDFDDGRYDDDPNPYDGTYGEE